MNNDLISRQASIDWLKRVTITDGITFETGFKQILHDIEQMPPVNPQEPKTGHWIVHPKGVYAHLICDKCLTSAPYDCKTNYCPNCGCRMVEPQESEDKE